MHTFHPTMNFIKYLGYKIHVICHGKFIIIWIQIYVRSTHEVNHTPRWVLPHLSVHTRCGHIIIHYFYMSFNVNSIYFKWEKKEKEKKCPLIYWLLWNRGIFTGMSDFSPGSKLSSLTCCIISTFWWSWIAEKEALEYDSGASLWTPWYHRYLILLCKLFLLCWSETNVFRQMWVKLRFQEL